MQLLAATANRGKARELAAALGGLGFDVVDISRTDAAGVDAPEETGATFAENAVLKARYYRELTGLVTVADDSGSRYRRSTVVQAFDRLDTPIPTGREL